MPRGVYERRKIMTDVKTNGETEVQSSFLEGLEQSLLNRDTEITMRLNEIETQNDALEVEEKALKQEQKKVQDGLKTLLPKKGKK